MLTSFFILLSLSMSSTVVSAQDFQLFKKHVHITTEGDTVPYRLLLPEHYDSLRQYPIILFLHGAGERGDDNEAQLTHGASSFLKDTNRSKHPSIVIAPQCPKDSYWASVEVDRSQYPLTLTFDYTRDMTYALKAALDILDKTIVDKSADPKRVYITGLSMGGMGTFEAVYKRPELFAAAIPICGGGDDQAYSNMDINTPFWIFHGDADQVVEVNHSRKLYDILKEQHTPVQYTEYPNVNHNSWDKAYREEMLFTWLYSQVLGE